MSSIYAFDEELSAAGSLATGDKLLIHQASSSVKKTCLASDIANLVGGAVGTVNTTATVLSLTQAAHAGKIVTVSSASPIAITLPATTGTGNTYTIQLQVAATATGHTINRATTADVMQGFVTALTTASANVIGYKTTATDNTITLNGTTQGGVVGDIIELIDVKAGFWAVMANTAPTGTTATPFSHV